MNWNDVRALFHSPYSAWGLRYRASKLPKGDYRDFLIILAEFLARKWIDQLEAKWIVGLARNKEIDGLEIAVSILENIEKNKSKMRDLK